MLQVVPPHIWLPACQIVWGVLNFWYALSPPLVLIVISMIAVQAQWQTSNRYNYPGFRTTTIQSDTDCVDLRDPVFSRPCWIIYVRRKTLYPWIVGCPILSKAYKFSLTRTDMLSFSSLNLLGLSDGTSLENWEKFPGSLPALGWREYCKISACLSCAVSPSPFRSGFPVSFRVGYI